MIHSTAVPVWCIAEARQGWGGIKNRGLRLAVQKVLCQYFVRELDIATLLGWERTNNYHEIKQKKAKAHKK